MQKAGYKTELYKRIYGEISTIKIIDCHEHLQRESELPKGDDIHIGRFFTHYANCDLISAGMPVADMNKVNSRAALLNNLFMKYPKTGFDTTMFLIPIKMNLLYLPRIFPMSP